MLPNGWKFTTLGKVCEGNLQTGPFGSQLHAHEYQEEGIPVLMPKDIINCRADISNAAKITSIKANELQKHILSKGDLLFSRRGDVARFALIDEKSEGSLCGTGCLKARPSKKHNPIFLSYFLQKNVVKAWLEQNAVGQTMLNMNTAILSELPLISASSREEEDKIAQILSSWDKAIEKLEALIAAKQKRKKALMQQLLTGKKRFAGFEGEWKEITLKKILRVRKELSLSTETEPLYSLTIENGVTEKTDRYNREFLVKDSDNKKYKLVYPNDIVYNPANLRWGAINISRIEHKVVVSPIYEILYIKNIEEYCHSYISHLLTSPRQIAIFACMAEGTLVERMAVKIETFLATNVLLPPSIKEQQKIAAVLSAADTEIEIQQKHLAALKEQKKGLMQQLLTGKKRVKINRPERLAELAEA